MAISSFDGLRTSNAITGVLHKAPVITGNPDITVSIDQSSFTLWTYGTSGADTVNQVFQFIFTATGSATTALDLATAQTNAMFDASATLTKIKYMLIEYLTVAQDATNGSAATGTVTIAPGASQPITTSPLAAAKTYALKPGDKWEYQSHDTNGITVTQGSADQFDFTNSAAVDAKLRITILGNS